MVQSTRNRPTLCKPDLNHARIFIFSFVLIRLIRGKNLFGSGSSRLGENPVTKQRFSKGCVSNELEEKGIPTLQLK